MLAVPREKRTKACKLVNNKGEEAQEKGEVLTRGSSSQGEAGAPELSLERNTSVFTLKDLTYTVKTPSGDRMLLENVQVWVRPGMLGDLMGSSSAGKIHLWACWPGAKLKAQSVGQSWLMGDPYPLPFSDLPGTVNSSYATVRETLEFSALLRQKRNISREEKLRYVDTVIDLLEVHNLENTLIGPIGSGLSVEQRK
jgi:ATP-binding cassette subfamily G (WHITE) protein 2 (SNQ2)